MKNVKRARQALADSQQAWNSTMHSKKHEEEEIVTLYTLAPETLDKAGTVSVGGYWLYRDDNVPEQVLREVLVDKESSVAQMQAYRLKIPYITFSEEGLNKALKKGLVYRKDETEENASIENALQETEEKVIMARKKTPKAPVAPKAPVSDYMALSTAILEGRTAPVPPCPALDAILAAPMGTATFVRNGPPKKHIALPEEKSEEALVAAINPGFALHEEQIIAEMYKAFVQAFKQALKEEGLVIVPAHALVTMPGCGEESPRVPAPVDTIADAWTSLMTEDAIVFVVPTPHDPMGDAWASIMDTPKVPAKPKSTLVLGPNVGKNPTAPKAPARDIPGNNGKVPVDTIKAIQTAWKNKTATQAELAVKYGMDSKKVWFFCNRAKQLV